MSMVMLPSGRRVWQTSTGVRIGLLAQPRRQQQGSHADLWQRVLCAQLPREWSETPRVIPLKPPLWRRIVRCFKGVFA
jgi:hypothetical protein